MIPKYREKFNAEFTESKYAQFQLALEDGFSPIPFRVAETPIFIPQKLKEKLIEAGDAIIALIKQKNFKELTERAIPPQWKVPNENGHPHFLTFDFGLSQDENDEVVPKLIEMQGFPSLYGFQSHLAHHYKAIFDLDDRLTPYFGQMDENAYFKLLRKVVVGKFHPSEVALMDVDAQNQKTAIDFYVTAEKLGIKVLSINAIEQAGRQLFYEENGQKIQLKRIYNRLIFDEIENDPEVLSNGFDPREDLEIEWITHPSWFYRISKFTMPFLKHDFVPETRFLNEIEELPTDLENYVLKPLFSFAGIGVIIDVQPEDITAIRDPENWILQKKITYAPLVKAPDAGVKVEIRLMYLWPDGEEPQLCINLARLSRGKMIGVRYNKDF